MTSSTHSRTFRRLWYKEGRGGMAPCWSPAPGVRDRGRASLDGRNETSTGAIRGRIDEGQQGCSTVWSSPWVQRLFPNHCQTISVGRGVRRFTIGVSLAMIILCNAIVLVGLWASGINLDELAATPDVFNSKQDICLRLGWQSVTGAAEPVPLCSEWINLSDPSGKTHQIATGDQASARAGRAVLCGSGGARRLSVAHIGAGCRGSHCVRAGGEMVSGRPVSAASRIRRRPWGVTRPLN